MKHPTPLRLVLIRNLLGSALLATPLLAITPAEFDSLRAKADRGNSIAQYNLGLAHADRSEAIYDPAQAYAWLTLASANGTNGKALAQLTSLLTPEQLAEGQRRVALLSASPVSPAASPVSPISAPDSTPRPAPVINAEPGIDQKKLSAELSAAWKENELLKAGLTAQLADANKRVAIAEAALASKDKEIAILQQRLTAATSVPAASPIPPVGVSAELASLRAERDQLQASATAALSQLGEFRAQNAAAAAETATLREKLTRASADLAEARRTQNLAEAESASLKAAADRATAERLAATAQLETLTAELAAAKAATPADAAPATLAAETAPAPAADTTDRIADLEKAKAESDDKLAASLRSFTLQQTEIDRLQKALASIDEERAATAAKLDAATSELATLRPQAASTATVSADAESLRTQLDAANQTITTQAADLTAANRALTDARATIDTATADLVAARDQLRQTQAQSAAFAVENQQLKTRLALAGSLATTPAPSRPGSIPAISINLPSATVAPATPVAVTPAAPRVHTVAPGDSLSKISKQYYGTAGRWNEILQANQAVIRNPDALALGTQLRIP
jgi:nucleoid-associated protein YgaU